MYEVLREDDGNDYYKPDYDRMNADRYVHLVIIKNVNLVNEPIPEIEPIKVVEDLPVVEVVEPIKVVEDLLVVQPIEVIEDLPVDEPTDTIHHPYHKII